MKVLTIITLSLIFVSCGETNGVSENENIQTLISQNSDFLPLPYGQPESSDFKSLKWGEFTGLERENAKKDYIDFSIESEVFASKIVENIDLESTEDIYESIPTMQKRMVELRLKEDTFLAEQYVAFNMQRKLFNNLLFTPADIENNRAIQFNNKELAVLAFSIELLVENGNPNTELVALNASHLKNYIGRVKMKELATTAINNANKWFNNPINCTNCPINYKSNQTNELKMKSINNGIEYLSQF